MNSLYSQRPHLLQLMLFIALVILLVIDVIKGTINIPVVAIAEIFSDFNSDKHLIYKDIILIFRLPKALTAVLAGVALSLSGLQMQTLFRNPLAGPYVLGVSSGASLFVALAIMAGDVFLIQSDLFSEINLALAAGLGAGISLLLILLVSEIIRESSTVLIVGLMFAHLTGAVVIILQYFSDAKKLQGFVMWGMGSFSNVVWNQFGILLILVVVGSAISLSLGKSLNAYQLGDSYASSMGLNVKRTKLLTIISTALLAGGITAFCGPIAFLGIAVPHLAKNLIKTADHTKLIPIVALIGGILAIFCDIIAGLTIDNSSLPINAITSLVGAPVVIWVIIQKSYNKSVG